MKLLVVVSGPQGNGKTIIAAEMAEMLRRYDIKTAGVDQELARNALDVLLVQNPGLEVEFRTEDT